MTRYEWFRWLTFPIMPVHLQTVRSDIKRLISQHSRNKERLSILDVGGRKSPYTIGIAADITLLDVPQEAGTKSDLNLGFTQDILTTIQQKRSNICDLIIQDMTQSTLADASYDTVVCIEVIEHVEQDDAFVKHIAKVLKKGGWAYFTTPNGDYIKNEGPHKNPDHLRHYTKAQLQNLLERYFDTVEVHYAVATGRYRVMSLKSYNIIKPIRVLKTIFGILLNKLESRHVSNRADKTAHLIAIVYK